MVDTAAGAYRPTWKNRRRTIFITLTYCAGQVFYITAFGKDTAVNEAAVTGLLILAAGVIGSYVFGAAWDDRNVMEHMKG